MTEQDHAAGENGAAARRCGFVALIGAPNVGKSTLANQLFGQQRSITADVPGTTRDWVGEIANINGLPVMLLDTPGIRETSDAIERESIARASGQVRVADLIVIVLDLTQPLDQQRELVTRFPQSLIAANKCDLTPLWKQGDDGMLRISARSGQHIEGLREVIRSRFISKRDDRPRWWTVRQGETVRALTRDHSSSDNA